MRRSLVSGLMQLSLKPGRHVGQPLQRTVKPRSLVVFLAALTAAILLGACGPSTPAAQGKKLYESGGSSMVPCTTCHTLDGTELVGPSLQGIGSRAGERIPGLSAEDYLEQSILYPSSYLVEGYADSMLDMYSKTLTQEEIDALVAYLITQD